MPSACLIRRAWSKKGLGPRHQQCSKLQPRCTLAGHPKCLPRQPSVQDADTSVASAVDRALRPPLCLKALVATRTGGASSWCAVRPPGSSGLHRLQARPPHSSMYIRSLRVAARLVLPVRRPGAMADVGDAEDRHCPGAHPLVCHSPGYEPAPHHHGQLARDSCTEQICSSWSAPRQLAVVTPAVPPLVNSQYDST